MDAENIYVQNLSTKAFAGFGATAAELISFALDEVGLLDDHTLVNGKSARDLAEQFYRKRKQIRQNSRLGNLLVQHGIISKAQLIEALHYHVTQDIPLGKALLHLQFCSAEQLEWALRQQVSLRSHLPKVD